MISMHKTMGFAMMLALGAGCAVGADDDFNTDDESVDSANSALEADERGGYATQSQAQAQVGQMGPSKLGLPPSKGLPSKGVPMLPSKGELPSKGGLLPSKGEFPTKGLPTKGGYPSKGGYAQQGPAQLGQASDLSQAQIGQAGPAQIGQAGVGQIGQAGVGQTGLVGQETGQREGERCIGGFGGGFGWGGLGFGGLGFGGLGCGFGGGAIVSSFTNCTTAIVPWGGFGGFGGCGGFGW
ncbi:hypothetical protein WMF45_44080 [Sorangium sp. So ce448]|uniref:hypothetical protein n=1 Tax=Sorangium sp. So ce448 TaxID=3133314 RepID=UPI003F635AB1